MLTIFIFSIFMSSLAIAKPQVNHLPLSLPWSQTVPNDFREVPHWKYYFGDTSWGILILTGSAFDMEAELQIRFLKKKISNATLILGPGGLADYGCITSYKEVVRLLTVKYGKPSHTRTIESEIKEDLIYSTICRPIRVGLFIHKTVWNLEEFLIVATIFGDDVDIFIEVDYVYKPIKSQLKTHQDKKLLKML